jgi:hypothetical protein
LLRLRLCLTALLCAPLLAACGGAGEKSATEPRLPDEVSAELASRSDAIADAYASGDVCGAARRADELLAAVDAAIAAGKVPTELQEHLTTSATELVEEINCPAQPAAPPPTEEEQDACAALVEQKDALEEQRSDLEGEDVERLDEQIAALEAQIEACQGGDDGGDGDDDDD